MAIQALPESLVTEPGRWQGGLRALVVLAVFLWIGNPLAGVRTAERSQGLEQWLEAELLPYLADRFGRHPRLKGEPFEVVAMKGSQVVGEMDGLTAYLKGRIVDRMQSVPGANLVWRPPEKPWVEDGKFMELECHGFPAPRVQLGIEVEPMLFGENVRVAVQAVDLAEKGWVKGLKKVWVGRLSQGERRRLKQTAMDRQMLGTRTLPFRSNQPDLLSLFFARHLGCSLQDLGEKRQRIRAADPPAGLPSYFVTAFDLIKLRLGRFQEVQMVPAGAPASKLLSMSVHRIDGDLHYVWVGFRALEAGAGKSDLAAEAYVRLAPGKAPLPSVKAGSLISRFDLITPLTDHRCRATDPWSDGVTVLASGERLMTGDCFAIRYRAREPSWLYLFAQMSDGKLYRLFPDRCDALELSRVLSNNWVRRAQAFHVPRFGRRKGYFTLDSSPGIERLYAVAIAKHSLAITLPARLGIRGDLCGASSQGAGLMDLGQALDKLGREGAGQLDWQVRTLVHVAR